MVDRIGMQGPKRQVRGDEDKFDIKSGLQKQEQDQKPEQVQSKQPSSDDKAASKSDNKADSKTEPSFSYYPASSSNADQLPVSDDAVPPGKDLGPPVRSDDPPSVGVVTTPPIVIPPKQKFPSYPVNVFYANNLRKTDVPPDLFATPPITSDAFYNILTYAGSLLGQPIEVQPIKPGIVLDAMQMVLTGTLDPEIVNNSNFSLGNYSLRPEDCQRIADYLHLDMSKFVGYQMGVAAHMICRINNSTQVKASQQNSGIIEDGGLTVPDTAAAFTIHDVEQNQINMQMPFTTIGMMSEASFRTILKALGRPQQQTFLTDQMLNDAFLLVAPPNKSSMTPEWAENIFNAYGLDFRKLVTDYQVTDSWDAASRIIYQNNTKLTYPGVWGTDPLNLDLREIKRNERLLKSLPLPTVTINPVTPNP